MKKTILLLITLIVSQVSVHLDAQEVEREPNILIFTKNNTLNTDNTKLINEMISMKLQNYDLNSINVEDDMTIDELLESAGWLGAFFTVETKLSDVEAGAIIEVNCYSTWNKQLLISIYKEDNNLSLSENIASSMDKILPVILSNLEIVKSEPPPGWDWWAENEETAFETEVLLEEETIEQEESNEVLFSEESPSKEENIESLEIKSYPFHITVAGAPLISTFKSTEYYKVGSHVSLSGVYKFYDSSLVLAAGARMGWDHFTGEGVLISSKNNFYYFGPEFLVGLKLQAGGMAFMRFSTGLSYLTIDSQNLDSYLSSQAYISFGMGVEFPISEHFGIYYSGDYTLHFEKSTVFSGFYPTIGLNLKI